MSHLSQEDGGPTRAHGLALAERWQAVNQELTERPWGCGLGGTPTPATPSLARAQRRQTDKPADGGLPGGGAKRPPLSILRHLSFRILP